MICRSYSFGQLDSDQFTMPSYGVDQGDDGDKPCRACTDFKSWAKNQGTKNTKVPEKRTDCPLDKEELGRNSWGFLHTMAAYFPDKPTANESLQMSQFFNIFAQFYPCEYCAEDLREDLKKMPPKTNSRTELSKWLCDIHNNVNVKLGKAKFDCSKVNERWKDGWVDGSCD